MDTGPLKPRSSVPDPRGPGRFDPGFSPKSALRLGIGLGGFTSSGDREGANDGVSEVDRDSYTAYLETLFQRYVNPSAPVNFYWGAGPYVEVSHSSSESVTDSVSWSQKQDVFEVGAKGIMGVEWFASADISLHADYTAVAGYGRNEMTLESTELTTPDLRNEDEEWFFNAGGVRFGLSVYF